MKELETLLTQYALEVSDLTLAQTQNAYSKTQIESKKDRVQLARTHLINYVKEIK